MQKIPYVQSYMLNASNIYRCHLYMPPRASQITPPNHVEVKMVKKLMERELFPWPLPHWTLNHMP